MYMVMGNPIFFLLKRVNSERFALISYLHRTSCYRDFKVFTNSEHLVSGISIITTSCSLYLPNKKYTVGMYYVYVYLYIIHYICIQNT
jgi:hypothetical protein